MFKHTTVNQFGCFLRKGVLSEALFGFSLLEIEVNR